MSPRQQPQQQPPPQQRLRVRYAKRGRARFASHRDIGRALERALRRAAVPMAYSSGFSPHPRISYAGASPTGAASESEYLELGLARVVDPEQLRQDLNRAMPEGLVVLAVAESGGGSLSEELVASRWRLRLPGVSAAVLDPTVQDLLAVSELAVQRMTKSGMRSFDVRNAVVSLVVDGDEEVDLVSLVGTPLVRPDDVLAALQQLNPDLRTSSPAVFTRLAQGGLIDGEVVDPLTPSSSN